MDFPQFRVILDTVELDDEFKASLRKRGISFYVVDECGHAGGNLVVEYKGSYSQLATLCEDDFGDEYLKELIEKIHLE